MRRYIPLLAVMSVVGTMAMLSAPVATASSPGAERHAASPAGRPLQGHDLRHLRVQLLSKQTPLAPLANITISLSNASKWCIGPMNANNVSGQPIWLVTCSGAGDDHWMEVGSGADQCSVNSCDLFELANDTSLCLDGATSDGTVVLHSCGNHTINTECWYPVTSEHFANCAWGGGILLSVAAAALHDELYDGEL